MNDGIGGGNGGVILGGGGGDSSDSSQNDSSICRDYIRNVCTRGKSCRFIHPDNVKIRADPIFCHDFQQGRCFRLSCKFVHCTREEEAHFKATGELPIGMANDDDMPLISNGKDSNKRNRNKNDMLSNGDLSEIPLCKDFLNDACDRPPGVCKFRHAQRTRALPPVSGGRGFGRCSAVQRRLPAPAVVAARRKVQVHEMYDEGPEAKRYQSIDYENNCHHHLQHQDIHPHSHYQERVMNLNHTPCYHPNQFSNGNGYQPNPTEMPMSYGPSDAMKALEDENFMLKRRIEELKTSNEFLLAQNAQLSQLRINNSLSVGTSVAQVQPLAVSAVSVSAAAASAQPSIIGITSSSLTGTQPLPTISISTLPTVTPVSIANVSTLQPQPQTQPQIYIPAPPN